MSMKRMDVVLVILILHAGIALQAHRIAIHAGGVLIKKWTVMKNSTLVEIEEERGRQNIKWGEQNHSPVEWVAILTEEVGEVAKEAVDLHFSGGSEEMKTRYRTECIQVAAVAVAMIACIDRN